MKPPARAPKGAKFNSWSRRLYMADPTTRKYPRRRSLKNTCSCSGPETEYAVHKAGSRCFHTYSKAVLPPPVWASSSEIHVGSNDGTNYQVLVEGSDGPGERYATQTEPPTAYDGSVPNTIAVARVVLLASPANLDDLGRANCSCRRSSWLVPLVAST